MTSEPFPVHHTSDEGTPQGGPASPFLANILLDDLDKELERRGLPFVRRCIGDHSPNSDANSEYMCGKFSNFADRFKILSVESDARILSRFGT